jgi:hypothetical protein
MELKTQPDRENENMHGFTGIFVRAIGRDGRYGVYDIAELDADSLTAWLTKDGGSNILAENTVRRILGHKPVYFMNQTTATNTATAATCDTRA